MRRVYRLQTRDFGGKRWRLVEEYATEAEARAAFAESVRDYPMSSFRVMLDKQGICLSI